MALSYGNASLFMSDCVCASLIFTSFIDVQSLVCVDPKYFNWSPFSSVFHSSICWQMVLVWCCWRQFLGKTPALLSQGPLAGVLIVVRNKVRQSCISRTVWPRIAKLYRNLYTCRVCDRTGYDITTYFRPEVIDVRKRDENDASDGFTWNFSGTA